MAQMLRPGGSLEALQQLRFLCQEYEAILESSFDGIWVTDRNGVTLRVNRACERNYGIRAEDVIGRNVAELERQGVFSPSVSRLVLLRGERITVTQHTRSGRVILATGNPVVDDQGCVIKVVCNSRDVTELFELQRQLQNARERGDQYCTDEQEPPEQIWQDSEIVAISPLMQKVLRHIERMAHSDATVLITGETGVGKNLLARKIHELGPRRDGPFVEVNCGAIPETLMESEFFGYECGAFTGARREGKWGLFEQANGGTIVLDEIGELPQSLQVKLLRVLQERKVKRLGGDRERVVDVRVIAATNRDLSEMVGQGRFRADLYYRINILTLTVPPLRLRIEDIPPLVHLNLHKFNRKYRLDRGITTEALDRILRYPWPGNVRELENVIERLMVTCDGPVIDVDDLNLPDPEGPLQPSTPASVGPVIAPTFPVLPTITGAGTNAALSSFVMSSSPSRTALASRSLKELVREIEMEMVGQALAEYGSTRKAAKALGIGQATLLRKLSGAPDSKRMTQ